MKYIKTYKLFENSTSDEIDMMSDRFYGNGFLVKMYLKDDTIIIMDLKKGDSDLSGTDVMNQIIDFSDKNNLKIKLVASDNYGTPLDKLISFYEKFGFKIIGDYYNMGKEMIRYPI